MHPAIPYLLELQRLDQRILTLRAHLDGLPKRMRDADAQLNGARASVASAREALTQALGQRKKLELDAAQWKERAKKYRAQSGSVKTNEAYKALQQEISSADGEASRIEDQVLEQMMAVEEIERRVKHVEADLKEAETAVAGEKKQVEAQYNDEKKKSAEAAAERDRIAKSIPEEVLDLYTRISKKHPGAAMAEARGDQCRACGLRVLPHILQMLTSDTDEELFRCESCGRILYSLEPIPHATPKPAADGAMGS
jgi:predicted  nucleic acid-binding Zn-ribbon protein